MHNNTAYEFIRLSDQVLGVFRLTYAQFKKKHSVFLIIQFNRKVLNLL